MAIMLTVKPAEESLQRCRQTRACEDTKRYTRLSNRNSVIPAAPEAGTSIEASRQPTSFQRTTHVRQEQNYCTSQDVLQPLLPDMPHLKPANRGLTLST